MFNPFELLETRLSNIETLLIDIRQTKKDGNTPENQSDNEYSTRKEVSESLKLSLVTLNRLTSDGTLKAYRIGGRVLYKKDEIRNALTAIPNLKYRRAK